MVESLKKILLSYNFKPFFYEVVKAIKKINCAYLAYLTAKPQALTAPKVVDKLGIKVKQAFVLNFLTNHFNKQVVRYAVKV